MGQRGKNSTADPKIGSAHVGPFFRAFQKQRQPSEISSVHDQRTKVRYRAIAIPRAASSNPKPMYGDCFVKFIPLSPYSKF